MGRINAHLAHDMRTPLQLIYSCAQMIQAEIKDPCDPANRHVHMLMENVQCLKDMIADELEAACGCTDIVRATGNTCRRMDADAAVKGITLLFSSNAAEFRIVADAVRLSRILQNLISNALRFTPEGGTVRVDLRVLNDSVEICVSDTGPGIDPQRRKRLFDHAESQGGYGMGLAIARKFARQMNGYIDVRSSPGKGATFILRIPLGAGALQ